MSAEAQAILGCCCAEREQLLRHVRSTTEVVKRLQTELEQVSRNSRSRGTRNRRINNGGPHLGTSFQGELSRSSNTQPTRRQNRNLRSESPPPAYDLIFQHGTRSASPSPDASRHRITERTSAITTPETTRVGKVIRFVTRMIGMAWALWEF